MKKQIAKKINVLKSVAITGMLSTAVLVSCKKEEIKALVDQTSVVGFEDITVPVNGYIDSIGSTNIFSTTAFTFQSVYNTDYPGYFYLKKGFALSTLKDTVTIGVKSKYAAYAGIGSGNSNTYIVSVGTSMFKMPTKATTLISLDITNTTFAALSMKNGDQFAKKFGSDKNAKGEVDGTNGKDFLKVWIRGYAAGKIKDSIEVYLANFQSTNPSEHYIQKSWKKVDLSKLNPVDSVNFKLESSDNSPYGMNTPAYFAIDNIIIK
jgi:hypothetical protein